MTDCPSTERLTNYLVGKITADAAQRIEEHIGSCPNCQANLAQCDQSGDELVAWISVPNDDARFDDEPQYHDAMRQIIQMAGDSQALREPQFLDHFPDSGPVALEHFGQYRLLKLLGSGGMGAVYQAAHTQLEMTVAVKVLSKKMYDDPQAVARFEREKKAVGRLNHPNIIRATDAGEVDGHPFLVMEFADGVDCQRVVRAAGTLPIDDACEIVRQAAVGLQYAHDHNLIHRDIKPSNLLVTTQGQIKVLDLGLARLQSETVGLTNDFQILGTADYIAPEQAATTRIDHRADIYGLGCTLYALICGAPPFAKYGSAYLKLKAHESERPISVREHRQEVSRKLSEIVDKAMAKSPAARFQSAADLAEALEPFAVGSRLALLVENLETAVEAQETNSHADNTFVTHDYIDRRNRKPRRRILNRRLLLATVLVGIGLVAAVSTIAKWEFISPSPAPTAAVVPRAVLNNVSIPSEPTRSVRLDERVARWALDAGALVFVTNEDRFLMLEDADDLENGFRIHKVSFQSPCELTNEKFADLRSLRRLVELEFQDQEITDYFVDGLALVPFLDLLELRCEGLSPSGVDKLDRLPGLRELRLVGPEVNDDRAAEAAKIRGLHSLILAGPSITDNAIKSVGKMKNLETLCLRFTGISDEGLRYLENGQKLNQLFLPYTQLTDGCVKYLKGYKRLEWLNLSGTKLTDQGLRELSEMHWLNRLSIQRLGISDEGLTCLQQMSGLRTVQLEETSITDHALENLSALKQVTSMHLGFRLSPDAIRQLRLNLPHCEIVSPNANPE